MIIPVKEKHLIEVVADLAAEIWTEHYTAIIGSEQVEYMLDKFQSYNAISKQIAENSLYYLIKEGDQYVGYFAAEPKDGMLFLSKYYVKSSQRGKGFGKAALAFVEELAKKMGLKKIALTVNKHNTVTIDIYQNLGFINKGAIVTEIGKGFKMDDYLLEKTLPNENQCILGNENRPN
jgi:GNAT superfamily N-acetyltransferase